MMLIPKNADYRFYYQAGNDYFYRRTDTGSIDWLIPPTLYIGGIIHAQDDWQKQVVDDISNELVILFNPRRENCIKEKDEPSYIYEQLAWEYHHLMAADAVLFWFSSSESQDSTLAPVALCQLGMVLKDNNKKLFVGCSSNYVSRHALAVFLSRARPSIELHYKLDNLITDVKANVPMKLLN